MKFKILPMLLALSVLPASTVWANDEIETGQVVISASRQEQLLADVSTNIDIITSEDIQKMGATSVYDLLRSQTGIDIGNKSMITVRGMDIAYVLMLIDGRRMVGSENKTDGLNNFWASININNIERIEVIRGAAAAIYGADAMAGVINIITKKGLEEGGSITTSVGNKQLSTAYTYDFGRQGNWTGKIDARVAQDLGSKIETIALDDNKSSGDYTHTGAYTTNGIGTDLNIGASIGYYFNDNHDVLASYNYNREGQATRSYDTSEVRTDALSSRYDYHNGAFDFRGSFGEHQYSFTPQFSFSELVPTSSSSKNYTYLDLGFDSMDIYPLNHWNTLTAGVSYRYSTMEHSVVTVAQMGDSSIKAMNTVGAFLQDEMLLLNESLILYPSVRFDYSNYSTPQFTAKFGATWEFIRDQRLKFNIGQAYRIPTLTQLAGAETNSGGDTDKTTAQEYITAYDLKGFYVNGEWVEAEDTTLKAAGLTDGVNTLLGGTSNTSAVMMGVEDLEPEKAVTIDGRYEGNFGPLSTAIGAYYTIKDSALSSETVGLIYYDDTLRALKVRTNIPGYTYYMGAEAELAYSFLDYLNASLGYVWQNNQNEDGYRLATYATHTIDANLGFNYPDWAVFANVWAKYRIDYQVSADSATADNSYAAYNHLSVNASVGKYFKDNKYSLVATAENFLQNGRTYEYKEATSAGVLYASNPGWTAPSYKLTFTANF